MKRPTWATVVGIIGVIIGVFGILGAGQTIVMPSLMEMQKDLMVTMQKNIQEADRQRMVAATRAGKNPTGPSIAAPMPPALDLTKLLEKLWNFPPWFKTWSLISGIISAVISGFYLFSAIALLSVKKHAISCVYGALGTAAVWTIIRSLITVKAMGTMGYLMFSGSVMGIVVHMVLLIVVATSNKDAYQPESPI